MARKTKSAKDRISDTLLDLLGKKNYAEIKILELTDKANVARASFYRHFNSIEDVLDYIAEQYTINFNEQIIPLLANNDYNAWYKEVHSVLTKIYEKKENFTDILSSNLRVIFFKVAEKNKLIPSHTWKVSSLTMYEHVAKITAFYNVCIAWIQNGSVESIDEMTNFMLEKVLQVKMA
ncbi:MAG: TetR/AcrR family transcriptional regulator [Acholeplasmatales bacterium]|nr:TetR/AcrR family transcriptional regulator [Acholeplasmatales bacterium]